MAAFLVLQGFSSGVGVISQTTRSFSCSLNHPSIHQTPAMVWALTRPNLGVQIQLYHHSSS